MNTPNTNLSNQQEQDALLNAISETNTTPANTLGQQLGKGIRQSTLALGLALSSVVGLQSCELLGIGPKDKTEVEKLTPEQQKFADLLKPFPDGSPKFIIVDIPAENPRYSMPGLFRIEMKLINAKAGTYEITPWVSKKPIENSLNNAKEDEPTKDLHFAYIAFVIKRADGSTYSPTSTQGILLNDDNNPSTPYPYMAQLPENFTMDEFKKYKANALATKSYILNKDEELQLWISTETLGKQLATVKLPVKPTELLALANPN